MRARATVAAPWSASSAEIKDIIAETGEESKMLAKFVAPDDPAQVAVDDPGAA